MPVLHELGRDVERLIRNGLHKAAMDEGGPEAAALADDAVGWVKTLLTRPTALFISKLEIDPKGPKIRAGAVVVVSHDRYFLDKVVGRVVEVRDRKLHSYAGGFTEFWQARKRGMARAVGRVSTRRKGRARASHERRRSAAELERHIGEAERGKVLLEERIEAAESTDDAPPAFPFGYGHN